MTMNLIKINTKTLEHVAYDGKQRIASAQFTRALLPDEIEAMRKDPIAFLEGIENADESTQQGAA